MERRAIDVVNYLKEGKGGLAWGIRQWVGERDLGAYITSDHHPVFPRQTSPSVTRHCDLRSRWQHVHECQGADHSRDLHQEPAEFSRDVEAGCYGCLAHWIPCCEELWG